MLANQTWLDAKLERRLLVAEGLQEGERKFLSVERLLSQCGNRFLDLDCVQFIALRFQPGSGGRTLT